MSKATTASKITSVAASTTARTFMISGHIDISWALFLEKYGELIERAIFGKLPANFEPEMPNEQQVDDNDKSSNNKNDNNNTKLPQFDYLKTAPFLTPPSSSSSSSSSSGSTTVAAASPCWTQNPVSTVKHTITSAINSIPKFNPASDLSKESESCCYVPPTFVVGDADGADFFAQVYLIGRGFERSITVYHRGSTPRSLASKNLKCVGGFNDHTKKDAAMTAASDTDICWIRSIAQQQALYGEKFRPRVSGTEKNIARRRQQRQQQQQLAAVSGNASTSQSDTSSSTQSNYAAASSNQKAHKSKKNRIQ